MEQALGLGRRQLARGHLVLERLGVVVEELDGRFEEENRSWVLAARDMDGPAMTRFVHRIIMSLLLVAALVLIWNVLGAR
ncbi:hypothetical protein [Bradyrhizobium vignae]|uniref:Uncharacterized protein n=1 Tax=Bradyrhizobium vignae TaxID=1549949 RepID=A0ABS4A0M8_9BRAD|nr:hypothetical protein [Bradyrhizobium vignae]MBP0113965.1 hypothetical protein [Bradyrhizobium vignae]